MKNKKKLFQTFVCIWFSTHLSIFNSFPFQLVRKILCKKAFFSFLFFFFFQKKIGKNTCHQLGWRHITASHIFVNFHPATSEFLLITKHNCTILLVNYRLQSPPQIHVTNLRGLLVYSLYHSHQLHLIRWVLQRCWCDKCIYLTNFLLPLLVLGCYQTLQYFWTKIMNKIHGLLQLWERILVSPEFIYCSWDQLLNFQIIFSETVRSEFLAQRKFKHNKFSWEKVLIELKLATVTSKACAISMKLAWWSTRQLRMSWVLLNFHSSFKKQKT